MAYVRKYKKRSMRKSTRKTTRRFNITKKRYGRKYFTLTRWSNNDATYQCHYNQNGNNTLPSGGYTTQFWLDQVSGASELKNLFDNYRIKTVYYRWVIVRDPSQNTGATSGNGLFPRLNWVHDFNDGVIITRQQMYQHAGMREFWFTEAKQSTPWFKLKPASLVQQYETSTATAYKPVWGSFVDTNDSAMVHYGLKVQYDQLYADQRLQMEAKFVIECKGIS